MSGQEEFGICNNVMTKLFGTDGIRGVANAGFMTAEVAMKLGASIGTIFKNGGSRHRVVIGKDTRLSGYLLEPALTSGFISVGIDVLLVGPMPTPSVSMLTKALRADCGIVISASHNPFEYNGIKIFDAAGLKLAPAIEARVEQLILNYPKDIAFADSQSLGRAKRLDDAPGRYIEFAKNTFPKGKSLNGLKIVVDSANGSAYHLVKNVFWELGAEVIQIGDKPNGFNINDNCGSVHPQVAIDCVLKNHAHLGVVLDGDADRVILIDETGAVIDGDKILAAIGLHLKHSGRLAKNTIVATHLSNLGLERYLVANGIKLVRTNVGDKHVAQAMHEHGYNLGGEQSGHIIISDFCFAGDGIIAALQVLAAWIANPAHKKISTLCKPYEDVPQGSFNVEFNKRKALKHEKILELTKKYEQRLNGNGRILIRKSGTEPLIRVMIEADSHALIKNLSCEILSELG
jgi:phosphoglucosamine mutase